MRTVKFHELGRLENFNWDFDQKVLMTFIHALTRDAQAWPDDRMRRLCYEMLYSDVVVDERGTPLWQNFDPSSAGSDCWYNFMRSLTFVSHRPNVDIREHLVEQGEDAFANLYGSLTPTLHDWQDQFVINGYIPNGEDPAFDKRINAKKRYDLRHQPELVDIWDGMNMSYQQMIARRLEELVSHWADHHPHSYGVRNGFTQLCLWRWFQANLADGQALFFQRWTNDPQRETACAGFVKSNSLGWVFQTFWQPPSQTRQLGTAMLRHCLPLLPVGEPVFLTCPSTTGDENDSRYELYKKKFTTFTLTSYPEFLAPFDDAKPPFYHTGRKETVQ